MNIVWFSEIRWDYLKTRKQHLLNNFPKEDSILFIQPFNLSKDRKQILKNSNIICKTVPIFRGGNPISDFCSKITIVRFIINNLSLFYSKILIYKYLGGKTDVIIISNIFYIKTVQKISGKVIWDYNDDPEQFGPLQSWIKKMYYSFLSDGNIKIVSSSKGLEKIIFKKFSNYPVTISNGVELSKFQKFSNKSKQSSTKILGYIGVISKWSFDFELLHKISKYFPKIEIKLYGPQNQQVLNDIKILNTLQNVNIYPSLDYDILPYTMSEFTVGLIPWKYTKKLERLAVAKLLQYSAVGIPIVSFYMEQYVEFNNLKLCKTHEEFINGIEYYLSNSKHKPHKNDLTDYDWNELAKRYRNLLFKLN
jgi:hypothetical protein